MLVLRDDDADRPSSRESSTGDDLLGERAARLRGERALLAAQREGVLVRARRPCTRSATFSAVSGIGSTPYFAFIFGFTKRQPMVVS